MKVTQRRRRRYNPSKIANGKLMVYLLATKHCIGPPNTRGRSSFPGDGENLELSLRCVRLVLHETNDETMSSQEHTNPA